ncbi:MAG: hypothetical protein J7M29_04035 [Verrucomicrobia bacterium]|nr:hypothetical protein [Verrucomicrobiota bacterium]
MLTNIRRSLAWLPIIPAIGQALAAAVPDAAWVDAYNVVWTSPSQSASGSMPLGNGDISLNAWAEADGSVQFYIGKTDAWGDNARLLKVGKARVDLAPNPFADPTRYRQTLRLRDGTMLIEAGEPGNRTTVKLWADAHHPVIHLTVESDRPLEATAQIELWRTNRYELKELQVSDVLLDRKRPDQRQAPMIIEPDTLLTGQRGRIGWFHHNIKSVGPALLAKVQGLDGFKQQDPLLHRTFGAIITAQRGVRLDDRRLQSPRGVRHRFNIYVLTQHPSSPKQWLAAMDRMISRIESEDFAARREAHEQWWAQFWNRSWIRARMNPDAKPLDGGPVPRNAHPARVGEDQSGGNRFRGAIGRVSVFARALSASDIAALAHQESRKPLPSRGGLLFSGDTFGAIPNSKDWAFSDGLTVEAWVKPQRLPAAGGRIADKVTPGGDDGFLLDTHPGNSLRFICGRAILQRTNALPPGRWTHVAATADPASGSCRLYLDGRLVADKDSAVIPDEAAYVSQMYHLQRFITACAGRGAYPIKFNGSIFTVPPPDRPDDPDYRRWGPGYWWQNTRLPYISLCASGDFELMRPLFHMYLEELLPLAKYRTRLYCGHEGAFYPECIYFWGAIFADTYGWTPFEQREDKLQESRWHKWEWVGGLELCWMALDYYEHTLDRDFLEQTAIPFCREILTFFDQHYPLNAQGKLVMHPSQALETWWDCLNPMPETAGCRAVAERLLRFPEELVPRSDRAFCRRLLEKLPPLPLRQVDGQTALAPAEKFAVKRNIENPELYAVFPFRLIAIGRPHLDWGLTALEHRWDRGNFGWRQDDIFMAYLGLAEEARRNLVGRAKRHDKNSRFPAFWGPNYDWVPDQDHGGVLMKTLQAMALQTDGKRILVLPAWPKEWDVSFKLHAPYQTTVEVEYRNGKLQQLRVTPASRQADVILPSAH